MPGVVQGELGRGQARAGEEVFARWVGIHGLCVCQRVCMYVCWVYIIKAKRIEATEINSPLRGLPNGGIYGSPRRLCQGGDGRHTEAKPQ